MAQNFRRYTSNDVGTSAATLFTSDSYDTVVGISVANVTTSSVIASVYINDGSNDIYLIKDAPIPAGGSLELIEGMIKRIKKELGGNPKIVATGGLAHTIAKRTKAIDLVDENLNLEGIYQIYKCNLSTGG